MRNWCCLPVTAALDVLVGVVSREAHRLDGLVMHIEAKGDATVESLLEGIKKRDEHTETCGLSVA